jgi:hypothetical protein
MTQSPLPINPPFERKVHRGLITPRACVRAVLDSMGHDSTLAEAYGVSNWAPAYADGQGYTDPKESILFGNWNEKRTDRTWDPERKQMVQIPETIDRRPKRFSAIAEYAGFECEWSDEWSTCSDCGKAIRTQPDSYGWTPAYVLLHDCEEVCRACLDEADYVESELLNDCHTSDRLGINLADLGFSKWNAEEYEAGLHPGQTDDPCEIVKLLPPNVDYVFQIDDTRQFDISFSVWIRNQETDEEEA